MATAVYLTVVCSCGIALVGLLLLSTVETFKLHLNPTERRRV